MPLMGSLYVGASGLTTNQNALNTTAHNLSNIETTGYTRQQVIQASKHYDTVGQAYVSSQQVGLGVSYADVRSVRDYFLDKAYRQESGRSGYYDTTYNAITEMETLFGELEGTAFQESLTELINSVQELQKIPESATNQGLLVSKSQSFIERAQAVYNGLASYQDNINQQITGTIDKINDYGHKIWDINQQIQAIEVGGVERANDLRDARDQMLDELGQLAKISYDEGIGGVVTVMLEGVEFVTQDYVNEMGYITGDVYNEKFAEDIAQGYKHAVADSFYVPTWPRYKDQEVFSTSEVISSDRNTDIGSLKALYHARGNKRATYRDLYPVGESYPEFPNLNRITINGTEYIPTRDAAGHYNPIVNGGVTYNISDEGIVTNATTGEKIGSLSISEGDSITLYENTTRRSAIMNVMAEFDNLIHGIVTQMNDVLSPDGTNPLFARISDKILDGTDGWTADNLMISQSVQQAPSSLNNGFILEADGSSIDQNTADKLAALFSRQFSELNPDTRTRLTYANYYVALISENATAGNVCRSISENQQATVRSIDAQRQEVVGVSDSDELTQMIRYQNAYNASSRYINTVNAMLDTLLTSLT